LPLAGGDQPLPEVGDLEALRRGHLCPAQTAGPLEPSGHNYIPTCNLRRRYNERVDVSLILLSLLAYVMGQCIADQHQLAIGTAICARKTAWLLVCRIRREVTIEKRCQDGRTPHFVAISDVSVIAFLAACCLASATPAAASRARPHRTSTPRSR
jgi:hypothetical protein